jgi:hypothetical protein
VFNATFNNNSVILWLSILLVEETGVPRENHPPSTSHWQNSSHNVVIPVNPPPFRGVRLLFAQRFITIFNCRYHTSNHLSVCHKPTFLSPINCQSVDNCCIIINTLINLHDHPWPTHQQQSDFIILVLYDFIVQSILSSLLLLCYNLMIMNDYE